MNKFKFIIAISIALALTLSCAPADDDANTKPSGDVEIYKLIKVTDEYFTYIKDIKDYSCEEGVLKETEENSHQYTVNYSIKNKTLSWISWGDESDDEPFSFKSTSNELIGTWTKEKGNKDDYCWPSGYGVFCLEGYDITKAVFTDKTVAITRKYCPTDSYYISPYLAEYGVDVKIVDCNSVELTKGTEKIIHTMTKSGDTYKYKNISCTYEYNLPLSKKQAACQEAYANDKDYDSVLHKEYYECNKSIPDFYSDDDEG